MSKCVRTPGCLRMPGHKGDCVTQASLKAARSREAMTRVAEASVRSPSWPGRSGNAS